MEALPENPSVYDRVLFYYIRKDGQLLRCFGKYEHCAESIWSSIQPLLDHEGVQPYRHLPCISLDNASPATPKIVDVHELQPADQSLKLGLILQSPSSGSTLADYDEYFANLLLTHLGQQSSILGKPPVATRDDSIAERLVDLCNTELLFHPPHTEWEKGGREYLLRKISFFTSRRLPIQMALPAFPCKSSSLQKVAGRNPDRGEELALRRLHQVLQEIAAIYSPGASICIISDGHVFSDCIGVDDNTVDEYNARLQELNNAISKPERTPLVTFKSLRDIFNMDLQSVLGSRTSQLPLPVLNHYLPTVLCPDAEFCRQAMTLACQPNRDALRKKIVSQDPALVALYRGFSRFMLEDLALLPHSQSLSRSQRKKTAENVAFEMMLRNQAYSNLVELFLPDFVRLSIHAHANSGPKFGITLFDRAATRVVNSLDDLSSIATATHDLLHIPTPWHNCVVQISGNPMNFVTKSELVHEALRSQRVRGRWVEGDILAGRGGYFELEQPRDEKTGCLTVTETAVSSPVLSQWETDTPGAEQDTATRRRSLTSLFTLLRVKNLMQLFKPREQELPTSAVHAPAA